MTLLLRHVRVSVGTFTLDVDQELKGQVTGLFGPSGAGKTTLLEVISGIRQPESAVIQAGDRILVDTGNQFSLPINQRRIGYVPQDLALFPHMSVRKNLLYGRKYAVGDDSYVSMDHIAKLLEIQGLLDRRIGLLSGGEKQRVAFARAILASPRLLLLDEPLANLDRSLRERMMIYLQHLRDEFQIPMIYVSHDADEVVSLCDEVVVLYNGRFIRHGPPKSVFAEKPSVRYSLEMDEK